MAGSRDAIRLYRAIFGAATLYPPLMAKKIRFNARELFRLRRHETDPTALARYLAQGHADVTLLRDIAHSSLLQAMDRKHKTN
ncbi:hypothetical protein ACHHYP_16219 [Achlya hypogyna]|uniref:Complex 1 LYR protein domain-containing protein n=1 Tax=Achlya hypogyna TaxID=1202772 RepID=A0A1V9Y9B0_ACHHY|nr:hypothetical protein ACHHYP_16219 [Achlya hypogyna]